LKISLSSRWERVRVRGRNSPNKEKYYFFFGAINQKYLD